MKRLLSIILIVTMFLPAVVCACDGIGTAVLPAVETQTDLSGEALVAVHASNGCLFGMLSPEEKVKVYPAQTDAGRVRGITAQGINREKGEMRFLITDGCVMGMTRVMASVHISAEYLGTVKAIVQRNMGEGAELTATNVVACTIRRTASTVTHRMVGRKADRIAIGTVVFSGAEMAAVIYITDWDGDGLLDLALSVNPGRTATPKPTSTPKPSKPGKTSKPASTPKPDCGKTCIKIEINIEKILINNLNIESLFPCGKVEGC